MKEWSMMKIVGRFFIWKKGREW